MAWIFLLDHNLWETPSFLPWKYWMIATDYFSELLIFYTSMRQQLTFCDVTKSNSLWNDIWGASTQIPYWWRVTTLTWAVLLIISGKFTSTSHKHYSDLGSDTSSVKNLTALAPQMSFCHETICGIAKYRLFLQANFILKLLQILLKTFSFCLT